MEQESSNSEGFLGTLVAILIAVVTVLAALITWRASVIEDASGDADYDGLRAAVNAEETRALNNVNAYENYSAYTAFKRYSDLGDLIAEDQANAASEEAAMLVEAERANAHDLAIANQFLFPNKFLNRDNSYAFQRQLGEMWSDAAREKDLMPDAKFSEADTMRSKSTKMMLSIMVLGISLVLYSLVESLEKQKNIMIALGSIAAAAGVAMAVLIELGKM
jgi:hypothetical protein